MSKEKKKKKKAKKRAVPAAGGRTAKTPGDIYFDTVGVLFVVLDREGRVERINKAGCRILGGAKKEIEKKDWFRFVPDENKKDVRRVFKNAVKSGKAPAAGYESVLVDAKGRKKYFIWRSSLIRDEKGKITGLIGSGEEITKEKENKLKIKAAAEEARIKNRCNELRLKLWETADDGSISFKNSVKKMLALAGSAINCDRVSYNVIEKDNVVCIYEWQRKGVSSTLGTKLPVKFIKHLIVHRVAEINAETAVQKAPRIIRDAAENVIKKYAKKINIKTVLMAPFRAEGRIAGTITADICADSRVKEGWTREDRVMMVDLMNIISSVLTREKTMQELNENEKKFRMLFEAAPDAYYLNDFKGVFIDGNSAAEKLIGMKKEKLIGKDFVKSGILPSKYLQHAMKNLIINAAGRPTGPDEWELKNAEGELIPVEVFTKPVSIGGKRVVIGIARDIRQRKRAEKEINLSHQLLNAAIDSVFVHDLEGKLIYVNDAGCRNRGYKKEEILKRHIYELDVPEYRKNIKRHLEVLAKKGSVIFETAHYRKDRTIMPVEIHSKRIDIEGAPRILSIARDITERKKWEEEIRGRMDELDRILNVSSNGMRVIGRDGIILKVNRKFCGIMGYSEGELIGEKCSKILTSRCSGPGRTLTRVLDGETVEDEEIETVKKNGEKIICLVNAAALTDPAGGITGVVEEYKDITEKKIYERRLELNKKILSVVNDSVFLHTFSGNILFMNEAAYRQRGYEKHEIFLKGFNGISKGFNDVVVKELKKTGKAVFEDVHYRKDGSKMDVEINSSVVELGGETAVLSAARDFTERKKAREELEKSYEKLKELDDLKTSFTQMITHELRTPITSIKGYVSFILGGASGGINEKTREFLEIVKNNSERLLRLINDLLDAAKIESGAFMLEKETMSVEKVIDDVIKTLEGAARGKNIKFIKTGDFKDAEIYADEYRINQIILNFASNALKFSPEGAVIHIGFEKNFDVLRSAAACKNRLAPGKYARLYVKDEGKGIEKEDVENIFERFAQAGKGADRKKGTGLGLSIARSIARAHNGETWVESRGRGKGSVFNAAIPLKASLREGEK